MGRASTFQTVKICLLCKCKYGNEQNIPLGGNEFCLIIIFFKIVNYTICSENFSIKSEKSALIAKEMFDDRCGCRKESINSHSNTSPDGFVSLN